MNFNLPAWYDELFEFECESKGCVLNFEVSAGNKTKIFNFYDVPRFSQDASEEIDQNGYFADKSAVILKKVTRENIINFIKNLRWE